MTQRTLVTWVSATAFLGVARALELWLNTSLGGGSIDVASGAFILGTGAASAIHAAVIVWLASRSRIDDPARLHALIAIGVGFVVVNNVEAAVFGIAPVLPLFGLAVLSVGVHSAAAVGITRSIHVRHDHVASDVTSLSLTRRVGTFVLLGLLYAVIYFIAGGIIYRFVQEFYANKQLPSGGQVVALQAFVRGPLFVGIGAFVVRLVGPGRRWSALAVGCTLSGLGALTALLPPNPLFPDSVRLVHLAEVGISNAVFGLIVGWALARR